MPAINFKETGSDAFILESSVKYEPPAEGTNMARELLEALRRNSDRVLLEAVDGTGTKKARQWTGKQVLSESGRIATGLAQRAEVKPGQVVALFCEHTADEVLFALGSVLAGAALLGQQPDDGYEEILTLCRLVKPNVIVVNGRRHQMAAQLRREVNPEAAIVWVDNPIKGDAGSLSFNGSAVTSTNDSNNNNNNVDPNYYLNLLEQDKVLLADDFQILDERSLDQIAYEKIDDKRHHLSYMLTSGSTGRPKVVASTHEELMYGLYSMLSSSRHQVEGMPPGSYLLPLTPESIMAGDLPLDHGAGLNTIFLSLCIGSKLVVMPSYLEDTFWQAVHDHGITASISSTTFVFKLLKRLKQALADGDADRWDLSRFEWIAGTGAKMAFTGLIQDITAHYTHLHIVQGYGATEIGFMSMLLKADSRTHPDSVGHLFPGIRAMIYDTESGLPVEIRSEARGELHVWAQSKFNEYKCHAEDDASKAVAACHDEHGFYKTGDQVHCDSMNRLYVHGRYKDVLVLGDDWKIVPSELEEIIDKHPLVEQSAVVGIPTPDSPWSHMPRAFVKLISTGSAQFKKLQSDGHPLVARLASKDMADCKELIQADISEFVAKQVAKCKQLTGGVRIIEEFPRNGVLNKIDRKPLKQID